MSIEKNNKSEKIAKIDLTAIIIKTLKNKKFYIYVEMINEILSLLKGRV